ncbi:MAG: tryptophan--tRNA ligase [Gemmatimonadales bacterium]|nr:tryptophan--tRNA ligase [Gemmatimonadales bacterium]
MARVFSGIQPTGELHIGNWLGAVKNWVELQDRYDCLYCVVDLHAITHKFDPAGFAERSREMFLGLMAAGLDPDRSIIFVQSHVPQHAQLMWILTNVTGIGELERMTQFKDKSQRSERILAGLLMYPVLQAADILLYRADKVPVGEDQVQHLELSRELARTWNNAFATDEPFLPEPQALLTPAKRILGLDGEAKMSKSLGNTIGLFESPEAIWDKLRPAKTDPARKTRKDPGTPENCNVYSLHTHFSPPDTVVEVGNQCRSAGWGCIDCKRVLADNLETALGPIRARAEALRADPARLDRAIAQGAERARAIAAETLAGVERRMGFLPLGAP